jgi:hypothetical protein
VALKPKGVSNFDFTPSDLLSSRSGAGYMQLGDITLRVRTGTTGPWQNATTLLFRQVWHRRAGSDPARGGGG